MGFRPPEDAQTKSVSTFRGRALKWSVPPRPPPQPPLSKGGKVWSCAWAFTRRRVAVQVSQYPPGPALKWSVPPRHPPYPPLTRGGKVWMRRALTRRRVPRQSQSVPSGAARSKWSVPPRPPPQPPLNKGGKVWMRPQSQSLGESNQYPRRHAQPLPFGRHAPFALASSSSKFTAFSNSSPRISLKRITPFGSSTKIVG